jgi:pimeloyl-ACP methyl ester carboxylesterase
MARIVFTIHGINSDERTWHDRVSRVLEPHFQCLPLPHTPFRRFGWLKIFIPWLRQRAFRQAAERYSEHALAGEHPHLIAHSYGTKIAVQLMNRPGVRLHRVVFVGSPLPARFDWDEELRDNPQAFKELTNERGRRDRVIALAGAVGKFLPLLGNAGLIGFQGRADLIHDTGALRVSCPMCMGLEEAAKARIHNISWKHFKHSDWFIGGLHTNNFWLPLFWGFAPEEYSAFIAACLQLVDYEERLNFLSFDAAMAEFAARKWSWTRQGDTVLDMSGYVESSLRACLKRKGGRQMSPGRIEKLRNLAVVLVPGIVKEALVERTKPPAAKRRTDIVKRLHPEIAIGAAITTAVEN